MHVRLTATDNRPRPRNAGSGDPDRDGPKIAGKICIISGYNRFAIAFVHEVRYDAHDHKPNSLSLPSFDVLFFFDESLVQGALGRIAEAFRSGFIDKDIGVRRIVTPDVMRT